MSCSLHVNLVVHKQVSEKQQSLNVVLTKFDMMFKLLHEIVMDLSRSVGGGGKNCYFASELLLVIVEYHTC